MQRSDPGGDLWSAGWNSIDGDVMRQFFTYASSAPQPCSALDAKLTVVEWQGLSTVEALDQVGRLALQATNQAAEWCKFFAISQLPEESMSEYFVP